MNPAAILLAYVHGDLRSDATRIGRRGLLMRMRSDADRRNATPALTAGRTHVAAKRLQIFSLVMNSLLGKFASHEIRVLTSMLWRLCRFGLPLSCRSVHGIERRARLLSVFPEAILLLDVGFFLRPATNMHSSFFFCAESVLWNLSNRWPLQRASACRGENRRHSVGYRASRFARHFAEEHYCVAAPKEIAGQKMDYIASVIEPMDAKRAWVFKTPQNDALMAGAIVRNMVAHHVKTVGFIGFADAHGESWFAEFRKKGEEANIKLVASERFARNDTSVTGQALKTISQEPDAVLIAGAGTCRIAAEKVERARL